jgi:hypothetical protein
VHAACCACRGNKVCTGCVHCFCCFGGSGIARAALTVMVPAVCAFLRSVSRFLTFARMHLFASFVAGRTPAGTPCARHGMGVTRYGVEICARNVGSAVRCLNRPCWYKPIIPNLERNKYRSTTKTRDYNYSSYRVRSPRIFTL